MAKGFIVIIGYLGMAGALSPEVILEDIFTISLATGPNSSMYPMSSVCEDVDITKLENFFTRKEFSPRYPLYGLYISFVLN